MKMIQYLAKELSSIRSEWSALETLPRLSKLSERLPEGFELGMNSDEYIFFFHVHPGRHLFAFLVEFEGERFEIKTFDQDTEEHIATLSRFLGSEFK